LGAGAPLLIDNVRRAAVSRAAGVASITSAFPVWHEHRVVLALVFVVLLMLGNLRGVRESGRIFAVPTYFFLGSLLMLLLIGAARALTGDVGPAEAPPAASPPGALTLFLILRAFANGCTAMTGVEAISNGVPAFRPPEEKNAAATLMTMAGLCVCPLHGNDALGPCVLDH